MSLTINSTVTLHDDIEIPQLGLGVFQSEEGDEVENAVAWALAAGYRHIDTASLYRNERGVGNAVAASGLDRSELFVTTKVWNTEQGYESTKQSLHDSLERLGTSYADLFLVHWPNDALTHDTWKAMEELQADGLTRAIGVSNFLESHLDHLLEAATVVPSINQVEFHPHNQEWGLVEYCRRHGIHYEAWSPLKRGRVLEDSTLTGIGEEHGVTSAQVIIRWLLQEGIVAIPKSVTKHRIEANADLYGFELTTHDIERIRALDRHERIGPTPGEFF